MRRLREWASTAATSSGDASLLSALHVFAVTAALLCGAASLSPARQAKLCGTAERVILQHLSTLRTELMGLKVTQQVCSQVDVCVGLVLRCAADPTTLSDVLPSQSRPLCELCTQMCFTGGGVGCCIVLPGQPVR
jgi:hypothetical protein